MPARRVCPRAASRLASQATAAAGCPIVAAPAAVATTSPFARSTQPSSRRSSMSAGDTALGPSRNAPALALSAITSGSRKRKSSYRESSTSTAAQTDSVAASTLVTVAGAARSRPSRNAISGSTRGWMNPARSTGSPYGRSMPLVTHPYSGESTFMTCCLARLVRPSLAPARPSPAASRASIPAHCASYAVASSSSGCSSVNGERA
jgi:hypothetical protein